MREKIQVTAGVLEGLEAVRESGAYNMFDRRNVTDWLWVRGYPEAATWVEAHPSEYTKGIFAGFEATPVADEAAL